MSVRYHISPKTGNPNICRAKEGNCPLGNAEGEIAEHFDSKEDARKAYETHMEEKAKLEEAAKKAEKEAAREKRMAELERNWATPTPEEADVYVRKGYDVKTELKSLKYFQVAGSEITVSNISAGMSSGFYQYDARSTDVPMSYNDRNAKEPKIEFSDFGTRMDETAASQHLLNLEKTLASSNSFIDQMNTTISDAKNLYGEPKDPELEGGSKYGERYRKIEKIDSSLRKPTETVSLRKDKYPMDAVESYTYEGENFNLYLKKKSSEDYSVEVNMSSMSRSNDVDEFKNRIYELRNVLATVEDFKRKF